MREARLNEGKGGCMNMHQWDCKNSEGTVIKSIYTGSKSKAIASSKVKARFGSNACFVALEYVGEVPMKLEPIAKNL